MPPMFKTLEDMEKWYYGDINAQMIKKSDAHLISTTTAFRNIMYGLKVWSQVNYEMNAFAAIPKEPWVKTGWRLETAAGVSFPSGRTAEGTTSSPTSLDSTTLPTVVLVSASPKLVHHTLGRSKIASLLEGTDEVIPLSYYREQKGKSHARAISAYLVQDVDTLASTGFESLDRISASSDSIGKGMTSGDGDIYGLDRDGTTAYDAQVSSVGTTTASLRDLTVSLIDGVWSSITAAGGYPKVIFTNHKAIKVWSSLLEAERRFDAMRMAPFVPRFNAAAAVTPGIEGGFNVATYFGVPIIPCIDYDSSQATVRSNEIAPINMIDVDYVRFAVLEPTRYVETGHAEMLTREKFDMEGMYSTVGELRCYNFAAQGKLRDIK